MNPLRLPAGVGVVAMRLVAVQEDNLVFPGGVSLVVGSDDALAFFHIYNQETVVGTALQRVGGIIEKMSHAHGIKKCFFSQGTGGIDIIIGVFHHSGLIRNHKITSVRFSIVSFNKIING